MTDLTSSRLKVRRRGYDKGNALSRMEDALRVLKKARGHNCKRTAEVYNVSRKSLYVRYLESMKDEITGAVTVLFEVYILRCAGKPDSLTQYLTVKLKRGPRCVLVSEIETKLSLFCEYMAVYR